MQSRKEMKRSAKHSLKKHYWIFVIICLIAAFIGSEFTNSLSVERVNSYEEEAQKNVVETGSTTAAHSSDVYGVITDLITGNTEGGKELSQELINEEVEKSKKQSKILGRSRGVLSSLINSVTSGSILVTITLALNSVIGSNSITVMILIILSLLLSFAAWLFVKNVYIVISRRMFLEARCYEKLPIQRSLFLLKVKKWFQASMTMFVKSIYLFLWSLTIIGGIIKMYSYFLVPYIVAENPGISPRKAITLSRKMMYGHKWECFVFELSFIGWTLLSLVTLGLSDIFFTNPYMAASFTEYYAQLRKLAKEQQIDGMELLCDDYLYEHPSQEVLLNIYGDIASEASELNSEMPPSLTGIRGFIADIFGISLWGNAQEKAYETRQAKALLIKNGKAALDGLIYPTRLYPIPEINKRRWVENMNYMRRYSIWSIVMMFFIISFIGWVWEVSLHLISGDGFVNRGVLHGPWLPIYGSGGVMIILLLNKFRGNPIIEFITATVLCGIVEYFTSYYLEIAHNGKKWWDYSGYFLNLNGRICAEGLLTFGLGGMLIVYVLAPLLDNMIRRIPVRIVIPLCIVLTCTFTADQIYSHGHPNVGRGITDYKGV